MQRLTSPVLFVGLALFAGGCSPEYDVTGMVGQDGELRFNLTFTNEEAVDLDLHVVTPAGDEIFYDAKTDPSGGELDVDCYCGNCGEGPNENVFWSYGSGAPAGDYQVSVKYFINCDFYDNLYDYYYGYDTGTAATPAADYTLRFVVGGEVVETHEGTLETRDQTDDYTFSYAGN